MKKTFVLMLAVFPLISFTMGCKSVLPSESTTAKTQWQSFDEARASFERIEANQTTLDDMKAMGYDPETTPNIRILNYQDIIGRFLPNSSMRVEDLHEAIQTCIKDKDACRAYELELNVVRGKRQGNTFKDVFGFGKSTHVSGWNFKGLIITKNDTVIYKLWSGQPAINRMEVKRRPLGPFQELDGVIYKAASAGAGL